MNAIVYNSFRHFSHEIQKYIAIIISKLDFKKLQILKPINITSQN